MIVNPTVVSRYARALFAAAQGRSELSRVAADLGIVAELAATNPAFAAVLTNSAVSSHVKSALFDHLFADNLSAMSRSFLGLLARKRRESALPEIYREFRRAVDEASGITDVAVISAVPMPDDILIALTGRLDDLLGMSARTSVRTDAELIGGLVVRVGDKEYDGSVRTRLRRMHARLAGQAGRAAEVNPR